MSLPGHTRGHACIAVDAGQSLGAALWGRLLPPGHGGRTLARSPPPIKVIEPLLAFDRKKVRDNHARLTELYRRQEPDLLMVCAHDASLVRTREGDGVAMRAVVITKHGDLSVLKVQQRPDPPPPAAGQVRIAVRAAGVNFADHLARVGLYPDAPKPPCVVGYEVAGTIEAVGEGVDASRVGERVLAGTRFGGYAEIVNVKAADTVALPDTHELRAGRRRAGQLRRPRGRRCTGTDRCAPANVYSSTQRRAASASRRSSSPNPPASRSTAPRHPASIRR